MRSRWLDIGQVPFLCIYGPRDRVEELKLAKKERGQYPAIFTEQTWSVKDFQVTIWLSGKIFLRDVLGSLERAR